MVENLKKFYVTTPIYYVNDPVIRRGENRVF